MITGAAVVPSPPLLARDLTGRATVLPELREACAIAIGRLLAGSRPDVVAVVGGGPATQAWSPEGRLNLFAFGPVLAVSRRPRSVAASGGGGKGVLVGPHGFGGPIPGGSPGGRPPGESGGSPGGRPPGETQLPLALGIGAALLDEAGYAGRRVLQAIAMTESPEGCLRTGARVAELAPRVALLVVGDGSARCTSAAPGYFDERAAEFGRRVESALRGGDMAALAAIDASLAAELMATGRSAWQVLAGAVGAQRQVPGEILYADAPFGVAYYVCVHPL
ncbi:MAG: hypothetical protein JWM19_2589 [Actinomycetia bacterium]|nr:hypothetical protein [Actinomycetes bacterium]